MNVHEVVVDSDGIHIHDHFIITASTGPPPAGLDPAYVHTCDSASIPNIADIVTAPLPYILLWMLDSIFTL